MKTLLIVLSICSALVVIFTITNLTWPTAIAISVYGVCQYCIGLCDNE
jgi:hypothetical protein